MVNGKHWFEAVCFARKERDLGIIDTMLRLHQVKAEAGILTSKRLTPQRDIG